MKINYFILCVHARLLASFSGTTSGSSASSTIDPCPDTTLRLHIIIRSYLAPACLFNTAPNGLSRGFSSCSAFHYELATKPYCWVSYLQRSIWKSILAKLVQTQ
ncbi:uncharacterized protein LOC124659508 [Lolium rigidum]|uniref:uncharacterized protein LOC124659508 n=1 Tax=Lolium rigidum TaxID=89674 RepID=UPI001F5C48A3|nr:uncharacterized protein LOC124659508 [Lolium rigidum]